MNKCSSLLKELIINETHGEIDVRKHKSFKKSVKISNFGISKEKQMNKTVILVFIVLINAFFITNSKMLVNNNKGRKNNIQISNGKNRFYKQIFPANTPPPKPITSNNSQFTDYIKKIQNNLKSSLKSNSSNDNMTLFSTNKK